MKKVKPLLIGYHFTLSEGRQAADTGRLLTIRIDTNERCNLDCLYCAWDSEKNLSKEINFSKLKKIIDEGIALGIKSVIIIGGGEPTLYSAFKELVMYINSKQLIPVVITNGTNITQDYAEFLHRNNASVSIKYDSMNSYTQDYLANRKDFSSIQKTNIANLFRAYGAQDAELSRIAISFVITKININDCENLWLFCRQNNYIPNPNVFNRKGRGLVNCDELEPNDIEVRNLFEQFDNIDLRFGFEKTETKIKKAPCLQHLYSVYMDLDGYINPCPAVRYDKFNIQDTSLTDILKSNAFIKMRRNFSCLVNDVKPAMINLS